MRQIFSFKSAWINSKLFPLALKRMSLNSATTVPLSSVLNRYHRVIDPTLIIEGSTYQYIVKRVTITARGLLFIRSSFCDVYFLKDVPDCLHYVKLQSVLFELVERPSCLCVAGWNFSARRNWSHGSARRGPFPGDHSWPCATKLLEAWRFSRAFYLCRCYKDLSHGTGDFEFYTSIIGGKG